MEYIIDVTGTFILVADRMTLWPVLSKSIFWSLLI